MPLKKYDLERTTTKFLLKGERGGGGSIMGGLKYFKEGGELDMKEYKSGEKNKVGESCDPIKSQTKSNLIYLFECLLVSFQRHSNIYLSSQISR